MTPAGWTATGSASTDASRPPPARPDRAELDDAAAQSPAPRRRPSTTASTAGAAGPPRKRRSGAGAHGEQIGAVGDDDDVTTGRRRRPRRARRPGARRRRRRRRRDRRCRPRAAATGTSPTRRGRSTTTTTCRSAGPSHVTNCTSAARATAAAPGPQTATAAPGPRSAADRRVRERRRRRRRCRRARASIRRAGRRRRRRRRSNRPGPTRGSTGTRRDGRPPDHTSARSDVAAVDGVGDRRASWRGGGASGRRADARSPTRTPRRRGRWRAASAGRRAAAPTDPMAHTATLATSDAPANSRNSGGAHHDGEDGGRQRRAQGGDDAGDAGSAAPAAGDRDGHRLRLPARHARGVRRSVRRHGSPGDGASTAPPTVRGDGRPPTRRRLAPTVTHGAVGHGRPARRPASPSTRHGTRPVSWSRATVPSRRSRRAARGAARRGSSIGDGDPAGAPDDVAAGARVTVVPAPGPASTTALTERVGSLHSFGPAAALPGAPRSAATEPAPLAHARRRPATRGATRCGRRPAGRRTDRARGRRRARRGGPRTTPARRSPVGRRVLDLEAGTAERPCPPGCRGGREGETPIDRRCGAALTRGCEPCDGPVRRAVNRPRPARSAAGSER